MIVLIDNYDSFTFNLVHYLGDVGARCEVYRNDKVGVDEVLARKPEAIVLSPGPCTPNEAGICCDLVKKAAGVIPIFGVCLGHQAIGQSFGAKVVRAPVPMHGKVSSVSHKGDPMFEGVPSPFEVTRYHSLIVEATSLPDELETTAVTLEGDIIMALKHKKFPVYGVQFHPESIASPDGHRILSNFLVAARGWNDHHRAA